MQAPTAQHRFAARPGRLAAACALACPNSLGAPAQGGALVVGTDRVPLPGAPNSFLVAVGGRGEPVGVSRAPAFAWPIEWCA